ncbi:hypothetical protein [Moritella sp. F3]|uniref:hypothetical protein n=1 Tax=Moritella sp. F3 TaxID=2718882 RepID=UPI0018E143D0|nr:hypothetical protein [Moritella sp. F3]GIC77073.1 hypothetical protein FMO001_18000 [Moritella sp. F1]GIC82192.1 hypothetical protein FMO003_24730 [Moritella sp. F3]
MSSESNLINNSSLNVSGTEIEAAVVVGSGSNSNVGVDHPFKGFSSQLIGTIADAEIAMGSTPTSKSIANHVANIEPLFCAYAEFCLNKEFGKEWQADFEATKDDIGTIPRSFSDRTEHTIALYTFLSSRAQADLMLKDLLNIMAYDQSYLNQITSVLTAKSYDSLIESLNLVGE